MSKKKKPANAWVRFFRKKYAIYAKEKPDYSSKDITKLVNLDWKNISEKEKAKY